MIRAIVLAAFVLLLASPASAHNVNGLQHEQHVARAVILKVFGPRYGPQALRVSWCESRYWVWAHNGQYLGLFQMGDYARSKYGHSYNNAWVQARAAYRYFVESGRDWSPWACRP